MENFEYDSVTQLHSKMLEAIATHQSADPFAPVLIIANSPLEGLMLRRQLAEAKAKNGVSALANIQVSTISEFVNNLSLKAGFWDVSRAGSTVLEAIIYSLMESRESDSQSLQSMTTANAIAKVYKTLELVSDVDITKMGESDIATSTQKRVLELVLLARQVQSGLMPSEAIFRLTHDTQTLEKVLKDVGQIHSVVQGLPKATQGLLEKIHDLTGNVILYQPARKAVSKLDWRRGMQLISAPDPSTEASIAVRAAVRQMKKNHADRIAIVYADESQYLNQIQYELDASKVEWHGKSRRIVQQSVLYRTLDILLEALVDRTPLVSGFDRPKMMRLIQNGHLHVDGIEIASDKVRKFIRRQEIYGDVFNWLSILDSLEREATDDKDTIAREHLGLLVNTIETGLRHLGLAETWEELGGRLLKLTREFHENFDVEEGSIEERAWIELSKLLENETRAIDDLAKANPKLKLDIDPSNLVRLVRKRVGDSKVRHGNLSTGIFVGSISEAQLASFDTIFLLGATEGLLPSSVNTDPFLPSRLLSLVGEYGLAEWSLENQPENLSRILNSCLASANEVFILRPRGGTTSKLEDEPSRYLPEELNEKERGDSDQIYMAGSFRASFDLELNDEHLGPVSHYDQVLSTAEVEQRVDEIFHKSMEAWRNPQFNEYFGNLENQATLGPIWQRNHHIPLSSTRIDSYIQCPYKFFAGTILGLSDNDRSDVLDEFSATAFGIYFHQAMDKFIKDMANAGRLPAAGEAFSVDSVKIFLSGYLEPSFNRFIATGKNGWNRSLEMHVAKLTKALPVFFQTEAKHLRSEPDLLIFSTEDSFGKGVLLPEKEITEEKNSWNLEVEDAEGESHKIVGQVDRIDLSPDRKSVGIMDFKTGNRKTFVEKKLGILKTKQSDNVMTLQDVIYRAAALERFGKDAAVTVNFVFPTQPEDKMFVRAVYAHDPQQRLPKTLSEIKSSGSTGRYAPKEDQYCKPCEYLNNLTDIIIRTQKAEKANQ